MGILSSIPRCALGGIRASQATRPPRLGYISPRGDGVGIRGHRTCPAETWAKEEANRRVARKAHSPARNGGLCERDIYRTAAAAALWRAQVLSLSNTIELPRRVRRLRRPGTIPHPPRNRAQGSWALSSWVIRGRRKRRALRSGACKTPLANRASPTEQKKSPSGRCRTGKTINLSSTTLA